ncbi:hypothetical protein [Rhodomicrobium sp. R_RK_3]|nr:hypothetical protein [Rhodomicrobium sp. R_RK_3]
MAALRAGLMAVAFAGALGGGLAVKAADMEETPGADAKLAVKESRICTESCISDCRAERSECDGAKKDINYCRVTFQICARRCVVACSPR